MDGIGFIEKQQGVVIVRRQLSLMQNMHTLEAAGVINGGSAIYTRRASPHLPGHSGRSRPTSRLLEGRGRQHPAGRAEDGAWLEKLATWSATAVTTSRTSAWRRGWWALSTTFLDSFATSTTAAAAGRLPRSAGGGAGPRNGGGDRGLGRWSADPVLLASDDCVEGIYCLMAPAFVSRRNLGQDSHGVDQSAGRHRRRPHCRQDHQAWCTI